METLVNLLNSTLTKLFDVLLFPLSSLEPIWGLTIVSVLSGILLLLVYGKISNQRAIRKAKRSIHSCMLESILFRNSLKTSLKAQAGMFIGGVRYFLLAVPPILILMIPCLLILSQLNLRYNSQPFEVGDKAILHLRLSEASELFDIKLKAPEGIDVTSPVRDLDSNQISWRLDVKKETSPESTILEITSKSQTITAPLYVANSTNKIISQSYSEWWWKFLYPDDTILRDRQVLIKEWTLNYPERSYSFFGMQMHWVILFAIVSILSGIVGSRYFKVEI